MEIKNPTEKSQDEFYFAAYSKLRQRELYEKYFKIIKIVSGTAVLSNNNKQVTVRAGEFVFVNRGGFSRIKMYPDKNRPFRMLCLNFTDKFLEKYIQYAIRPAVSNAKVEAFESIYSNVMIEALFSSLDIYARNDAYPDKVLTDLKLRECAHILSLYDPHLLDEMFRKQSGERLSLEEFMNANYMYNAPLERFAELSGRSLSTFRREFEQTFGTTPSKWLIRKRLEVAYKKITEESCRPSDIYWELGFETLSHFSRKFKEQYNMVPSKLFNMHNR